MTRQSIWRAGLALLCLALTSGCWNRVELNDRAIVSAVGLDLGTDGQVIVSANVLSPQKVGAMGGPQGSAGAMSTPVRTFSAQGEDVSAAVASLQLKVPRKLFWGHARLLTLGEPLARGGVRKHLDFWTRERNSRLTTYVVVVPGQAAAFLKSDPSLRRTVSDSVRELMEARRGIQVMLLEFLNALASETQDPVAPRFELVAADLLGEEPQKEVAMTGAALFQRDRMVGWLDEEQMRGLAWLLGNAQEGTVTYAETEANTHGIQFLRTTSTLQSQWDRGRVVATLRAHTEGELIQTSGMMDTGSPEAIPLLSSALSREIEGRVRSIFDLLAREYQTDPMGVGEALRRSDPRTYARVKARWREELAKARLHTEIDAKVKRAGKHRPPLGLQDKEVQAP